MLALCGVEVRLARFSENTFLQGHRRSCVKVLLALVGILHFGDHRVRFGLSFGRDSIRQKVQNIRILIIIATITATTIHSSYCLLTRWLAFLRLGCGSIK